MISLILILIILILASAFLSASETSFFSIPSTKVKAFQYHKDPHKQLIYKLHKQPQDLLVTILFLNISMNILVQNISSNIFDDYPSWFLTVGIPLGLTLFFGEIIPKSVAIYNNEAIATFSSKTIFFIKKLLGPIRRIISWLTYYVSKTLFFFLKKDYKLSKKELKHALTVSEEQGILSHLEVELIQGYLNLMDMNVKELLRPKEDIIFFDIHLDLTALVNMFVDQACSRIPICKESLDDVLGVVSAQDFFTHRHLIKHSSDLHKIIKKTFYVPEATTARTLLKQFFANGEQISLVVNEYGTVSGLISLEDLMEVVVGDIEDGRDQHKLYSQFSNNVLITSGKLEISEFEDIFETSISNPHNLVTIGGWLTYIYGNIPKNDTKIKHQNFLYHILSSNNKRIKRIYIRKLEMNTNE